jgi:hypothetical protein
MEFGHQRGAFDFCCFLWVSDLLFMEWYWGDVVVAKKRREREKVRQQWQRREKESNVRFVLDLFFNRWITHVPRVAILF